MPTAKPFTTTKVAGFCHVSHAAVCNWVKSKKLRAYRTPGGQYRIEPSVLVEFMKFHGMPIPEELCRGASHTILVVDDEPEVKESLVRILGPTLTGYAVEGASDGFTAGKLLNTLKPELVLLDLHMPGVDGFRVLESIKADPQTRHIKVLVITAYATDENVQKLKALGADGWMKKPVDFTELRRRVGELIGPAPAQS
jgi:excisionase family DNA binding protein